MAPQLLILLFVLCDVISELPPYHVMLKPLSFLTYPASKVCFNELTSPNPLKVAPKADFSHWPSNLRSSKFLKGVFKSPTYNILTWDVLKNCQIRYIKEDKSLVNRYTYWLFLIWADTKLRWLGVPNPMVNDSDSKPSKLKCRFWSNSKSNDGIVPYQIELISFWLKSNRFLIKRLKKSIKISKESIKSPKIQLKDRKSWI